MIENRQEIIYSLPTQWLDSEDFDPDILYLQLIAWKVLMHSASQCIRIRRKVQFGN